MSLESGTCAGIFHKMWRGHNREYVINANKVTTLAQPYAQVRNTGQDPSPALCPALLRNQSDNIDVLFLSLGSWMMNVAPWPGVDSTDMVPPWSWVMIK